MFFKHPRVCVYVAEVVDAVLELAVHGSIVVEGEGEVVAGGEVVLHVLNLDFMHNIANRLL
jgi:hypothetical protein